MFFLFVFFFIIFLHQFHAKPPSSAKVAQAQVTNLGAGVEQGQGRAVGQWVRGKVSHHFLSGGKS